MATVNSTIGGTSPDYSTIQLWCDDLDNTTPYNASDDAVGHCRDATFTEDVDSNTADTLPLASVELRAESGSEHDGTDSGAELVGGARFDWASSVVTTVRWMNVSGFWNVNGTINAFLFSHSSASGSAATGFIKNCVFHDNSEGDAQEIELIWGGVAAHQLEMDVQNCMFWTITNAAATGADSIVISFAVGARHGGCYNNTIWGFGRTGASSAAVAGISCGPEVGADDNSSSHIYNNIVGNVTSVSGTAIDIDDFMTDGDVEYNASEDSSATDLDATNSVNSITSGIFVSTTGGSEDLHLDSGASSVIDQGNDLGTTPTDVNIDIDARDRDTEGDTWDMGADETVAAGGGTTMPIFLNHMRRRHMAMPWWLLPVLWVGAGLMSKVAHNRRNFFKRLIGVQDD